MKRIAIVMMLVLVAGAVGAAPNFQVLLPEAYEDQQAANQAYLFHRVIQWTGIGAALIGVIVWANGNEDGVQQLKTTGLVITGSGLGVWGLDYGLTIPHRRRIAAADQRLVALRGQKAAFDHAEFMESFTPRERSAIERRKLFIGMSERAMRQVMGPPTRVNRTVTEHGESKQHVFPGGRYVYTEDGAVTAWQD